MYCAGPNQEGIVIRESLSFDYKYEILHGIRQTGYKRGIIVKTT
jgi:hypothetical protein